MENKNFARVLPCFYLKISPEESEKFVNLLFFLCGSSKGRQHLVKAHKNGKYKFRESFALFLPENFT